MPRCKVCNAWEYASADAEDLEMYNDVFGLDLERRGEQDKHVTFVLYGGDDGHYWQMGSYSTFWLDSLIKMLQDLRHTLETDKRFKRDGRWGYKYK